MGKKDDFVRLSGENAKVKCHVSGKESKMLDKNAGRGIIIVYFIRSSKFERRREL